MKKQTWIIALALGLLAWFAVAPKQQNTMNVPGAYESPDTGTGASRRKPQAESWRQFARTKTEVESAKPTPGPASPLRVANPYAVWRSPVTGDRVQKLFELTGFESWPTVLPPANGHTFTAEDVLQSYPFLRGVDGSYDSDFVAKVQDVLQRIRVARQKPEENPFESKGEELYDELRGLLRPVLGWTPDRRGSPVPTPEFVAIVPEMREAHGFQIRNILSSLAWAQSAAERKPHPEKYAQDMVKVVGGSCRINIGVEQAALLLATPLERLVTSSTSTGGE